MLTCDTREEPVDQTTKDQPYSSPTTDTKMPSSKCFSLFRAFTFQGLVLFAVFRLCVYIGKIFEDGHSAQEYYQSNDLNFAIISAACLALPPLLYAFYLIGEHFVRSASVDSSEICTKFINGLLLFPWQIKRHLDVLHYAVQRVCQWRSPTEKETHDLQSIKRTAEILEFFEDIYAGPLQILLQTYLLFLSSIHGSNGESSGLPAFRRSELITSTLCVFSMLIAVRRRDDGIMTGLFSMLGWSSIFISRILAFTLATVVLRGWICIFFLLHIICFTLWVYKIAIESYSVVYTTEPQAPGFVVPVEATAPPAGGDYDARGDHSATVIRRKSCFTAGLVLLFFGIPSLLIWPFMFQLREKKRPFIFLTVIAVQNILFVGLFYVLVSKDQFYPLFTLGTTALGFLLLSLYVAAKPKYTDQVVLCDIREARSNMPDSGKTWIGQANRSYNATKYGIYYEFCDLVFRLPSTSSIAAGRREIQSVLE